MHVRICISLLLFLYSSGVYAQIRGSLWDVQGINDVPAFTRECRDSVYEIIYTGLKYKGKPKKTFAYYATPASLGIQTAANKKLPAVILVHGGGGTAFIGWVKKWARMGYAALAMDGRGNRPDGTHIENGFDETPQGTPIYTITPGLNEQWMFQAVADIILANNLLRSFAEIDSSRIALTGISWGAVLTIIAAGVDHRFKAAVPIYGCGYFPTSPSLGKGLDALPAHDRHTWLKQYDPIHYVNKAPMPLLFVNGTNDPAFFIDSYIKTYEKAKKKQLSLQIGLKHGHYTEGMGYEIREPYFFIDHFINGKPGLAVFKNQKVSSNGTVRAELKQGANITKAWLQYTTDTTINFLERKWLTKEIIPEGKKLRSQLPPGTTIACLNVMDNRGLQSSGPVYFKN